jgi:AcrR family transcriptional regulator
MKNRNQWIETGFELFAQEGHEGLQVERLARILNRNKSGFYHYFGTMDKYFGALMRHMHKQADIIVAETRVAQAFDPGFLMVMEKNKLTVMATMQLIRNRNVPLFAENFREVTNKIDQALLPLWANHIGVPNDLKLALRYFEMIRDMFFARITFDTLHYDYLHNMASEAKAIILELNQKGASNTQE